MRPLRGERDIYTFQCLCGVGRRDGLCYARYLAPGADDLLAGGVADEGDVLVLALSALPDLDLAAAAQDTYAHGGEEIVCGVGVVIDTAVEHRGGVLADARGDEGAASRVLLDEVGDVVNNARDGDQGAAILGLLLE